MKTIPLFISSTFNDMNLERDIMREHVLPMLKERYNKKGIEILIFDLRWGIFTENESSEKQKEKEILQSCFQIIDMCRPYFIAFIGNRLGWVPEKEIIEKLSITDRETKRKLTSQNNLSVTQLEIEYGVLNGKNFSKSLVFYRSEDSYLGLDKERLASYTECNPDRMHALYERKEVIRKAYIEAKHAGNIVDYTVNLSGPSDTDIYELSQIICKNIIRIIDKDITTMATDTMARDEIYLANYQEPSALINGICEDIGNNRHILVYGNEGFGKTSLSLALKKKLTEHFKILYYSCDYSEPLSASEIIKGWTKMITEGVDLPDLDSEEKEWARFLSLLARSALKKVIIMIDGIDKIRGFADSNIFFLPSTMAPKIEYIILSEEKLPKWERRFHISGKRIEGFSQKEALQYINMTCNNNGKSLPEDIKDELLGKYEQDNYSPIELGITLNYIMTLDRDDFEKISSSGSESDEKKIRHYLLDSIRNMPCSYKGKIDYIINRVIIKYGETNLAPFKYIALSLNGLSTDDLYGLPISGFSFTSFLLVRNAFNPYLSTFNDNGKWRLQDNEFKNSILKYIDKNEKRKIFSDLSNCSSLTDERLYYCLMADNLKDALHIYINDYKSHIQLYNGYLLTYLADNDNIKRFAESFNELPSKTSYTAYSQLIFRFYIFSTNNGTTIDSTAFLTIMIDFLNRNTRIEDKDKNFLLGSVEDTLAYLLASSSKAKDVEDALRHMKLAIEYYTRSQTNGQRIQYIEKSMNQIKENGHV